MPLYHQKTPFEFTRKTTYLVITTVFFFGFCLVLLGILFRTNSLVSAILNTLGIACVVSISTSLIQRYFTYKTQYSEMRKDVETKINSLLESRFDLLSECSNIGIRRLYPNWSGFLENVLPSRLQTLQKSFLAIGIGLSDLTQAFVSGALRPVIDSHLRTKEITFCTAQPDSEIVQYRERELKATDSTNASLKSSLSFLNELRRANSRINIKPLKQTLPRATILCLDDEVIFYSPYFSSIRTPVSLVIETHKGDRFFERIREDINHLLENHVGSTESSKEPGGK